METLGILTKIWAEGNGLAVYHQPSLDSTNTLAKENAFQPSADIGDVALAPAVLFLADHQTAGRGRGTNHWIDDGAALLSSWSFLLNTKPQPITSCLVGLAVFRALSTTWSFLPWNLKAPNDIYIGSQKVAGILLESVAQGSFVRLIVGLGLNIRSAPAAVDTAAALQDFLPKGTVVEESEWFLFLDRLYFEMLTALDHCDLPLTTLDQANLIPALNAHPLLKTRYTQVEANGTMRLDDGSTINWWEL